MSRNCDRGLPIFVSFSGIDGAGKSTQIELLQKRIEQAGFRVGLITFWDDVARLTGLRENAGHTLFKGDKGVGTPSAPINRRDKNVQSFPMTCVRLVLYLLDAISLRRIRNSMLRSGYEFVIFDRYIYDELANLPLKNRAIRAYARLILKITPKPHVSYLLDADPVRARARKPEYPVEFLQTCRSSYLDLSRMVEGMAVIPPMSVDAVADEVQRRAFDPLLPRLEHGEVAEVRAS